MLRKLGLTGPQAEAYLLLNEHGPLSPPVVAGHLRLSRTNAYKVLDSLAALNIAMRQEYHKKLLYRAADPTALANLVATRRNEVIALEVATQEAISALRSARQRGAQHSRVAVQSGTAEIVRDYETEAARQEPIYFIKPPADIPFMGFELMDRLRRLVSGKRVARFGITPDSPEAPDVPAVDARSNLTRTWLDSAAYTAPVEWSVAGDVLSIRVFSGEGRVISINDAEVADAFRQLWLAFDASLRSDPAYVRRPLKARRHI